MLDAGGAMLDGGPNLEALSSSVIGAAIEVHRQLGAGLLESAYQACLAVELRERRVPFRREVPLRATYRGRHIETAYRMDFVVADRLLIEVKAVEQLGEIHHAQTLTYLRLSGLHLV